MRPDPDTCREPELLAAEVRRLHAVNDRLRAEIERLRSRPCPYVTGRTTQYCTLTPFTLTDAEREALADAADRYAAITPESAETAATLRGLLDRTQTVEK